MSAWIDDRRHVLVITGTDVHPFTRLIEWADAWAAGHPDDDVLVQHGYTAAPRVARAVEIFTPAELTRALEGADVVVCHGGPGTISTVRSAGLQPVVVARDPSLGEHVDGHQLRFAGWAGERGLAVVAATVDDLPAAVADASAQGRGDAAPATQVDATVRALGAQIAALLERGPTRRRIPMIRRRLPR